MRCRKCHHALSASVFLNIKEANSCIEDRKNQQINQIEFEEKIKNLYQLAATLQDDMKVVSCHKKTIAQQKTMLLEIWVLLNKEIESLEKEEKMLLLSDKAVSVSRNTSMTSEDISLICDLKKDQEYIDKVWMEDAINNI